MTRLPPPTRRTGAHARESRGAAGLRMDVSIASSRAPITLSGRQHAFAAGKVQNPGSPNLGPTRRGSRVTEVDTWLAGRGRGSRRDWSPHGRSRWLSRCAARPGPRTRSIGEVPMLASVGRRGRARRVVLLAGAGVAIVCWLMYCWAMTLSVPAGLDVFDFANNLLYAQDMLHGNWLLHGWVVTQDPHWFTDDMVYVLGLRLRGFDPVLLHAVPMSVYLVLIVLVASVSVVGLDLRGTDRVMIIGIAVLPLLFSLARAGESGVDRSVPHRHHSRRARCHTGAPGERRSARPSSGRGSHRSRAPARDGAGRRSLHADAGHPPDHPRVAVRMARAARVRPRRLEHDARSGSRLRRGSPPSGCCGWCLASADSRCGCRCPTLFRSLSSSRASSTSSAHSWT